MNWLNWYNSLNKPSWTPSPQTIGLIWNILYAIILFSLIFVIIKTTKKELPNYILYVFIANLILNLLFTPIQFGLKNLTLASVDIILVWLTIIAEIILLWPFSKPLALLQIPYLAWVSTASIIQILITIKN